MHQILSRHSAAAAVHANSRIAAVPGTWNALLKKYKDRTKRNPLSNGQPKKVLGFHEGTNAISPDPRIAKTFQGFWPGFGICQMGSASLICKVTPTVAEDTDKNTIYK